jgi:hypothetical protein
VARLVVAEAGVRGLSHSEYLEIIIARSHAVDVPMPDRVPGLWPDESWSVEASRKDRHAFLTRVRRDVANLVIAQADARDLPYSDYLAIVIARAHGFDVDMPEQLRHIDEQEVLDISA